MALRVKSKLIWFAVLISAATELGYGDEVETRANPWEEDYRIPKDVIPVFYDMLMNPDLKAGRFKGEITASVNITKARTWIPIHIKNLDISKTTITNSEGKPVKVLEGFKYLKSQFWVMKTDQLKPGLYKIYLAFNGSLTENISGFYKSVYYENGTARHSNKFWCESGCLWRCQNINSIAMTQELSPLIPSYVKPIDYDVFINPNLETGEFNGMVAISIELIEPGSYIPVHIKNLTVTNSVLVRETGNVVPIEARPYEKHQFWVLNPPEVQMLKPGFYTIRLEFKGRLTGKIVGFYNSSYLDDQTGQRRNIATTKFEPVDARQAFPCFDEPALKAKFKIRIVRPKDAYSALSNMNVVKEEPGPGANEVTVHFAETVPMSTYLVCFIVSDFKDSGSAMVNNMGKSFPVKIYSTPGQVSNTLFAKTSAAAVSNFYINYFGIAYPLPKLDLIAIPDFVSGAMENWGLITFRETGLLFNEKENSAANKQRVAIVVSHEISHQWFGNLVTMSWWDDLWLNEGFASFMQYKGVDEGMPDCKDWQMLDQAIHEQIHGVLKKDSVVTSHPIIQPVDNPNQITEIFDSISYNKGHAVIKMLEGFMGENHFRKGIQKYLKAHVYSDARTPDLWSALNGEMNSSDVNVGNVMDTWTRQMGYPVVTVKTNPDSWVLTQSRFLADGEATFNPNESPYKYKWDIPIHYIDQENRAQFIWFKRNQDSVKIPRDSGKSFVKLNHKQLGFYRVNYDLDTWKAFEAKLMVNHTSLDRKDRANLLDDVFSLAGAGRVDYSLALSMTGYLKQEREFLPWATGANALSEVVEDLSSSIYYTHIRRYVRSLVQNLYGTNEGQFSWNVGAKDSHVYRLLRVKILGLACLSGLPACLEDAGAAFMEWIKKPQTSLHPDVRVLVYRYGMSAVGGEREWDTVWDRYLKETNVQEKINLLEGLASVRDPWLLSRFVELAKNEEYIRAQDYFSVLGYISRNPVGNPIVWRFFRNEWPYLVKRFTLYHRTMGTFIATVTRRFATEVELEEIKAFYKKYPESGAGANARQTALETVQNNINWLKKNEQKIGKWLLEKRPV